MYAEEAVNGAQDLGLDALLGYAAKLVELFHSVVNLQYL